MLKRKAFLQMLLITVTAAATVLLLRDILRGQIGDRIVQYLINTFHLDHSDAQTIYHYPEFRKRIRMRWRSSRSGSTTVNKWEWDQRNFETNIHMGITPP
ncbi:hypothetical protein, partial [Paenibacillus flagellatus]|uniref:hypothetical protein n=1 Tax=Paenibacillus flagellatus TaxID=2211139 RepID=UPI003CCC473C